MHVKEKWSEEGKMSAKYSVDQDRRPQTCLAEALRKEDESGTRHNKKTYDRKTYYQHRTRETFEASSVVVR